MIGGQTIHGGERLAGSALALWKRRGLDTLICVLPWPAAHDPDAPVGSCTTLRFVLGLAPREMLPVATVARERDFSAGVAIHTLPRLPDAAEFALAGYAALPTPPGPPVSENGTAPAMPSPGPPVVHPLYPPGRGAPVWAVTVPRSRLVRLASVPAGSVLRFEPRLLAPLP